MKRRPFSDDSIVSLMPRAYASFHQAQVNAALDSDIKSWSSKPDKAAYQNVARFCSYVGGDTQCDYHHGIAIADIIVKNVNSSLIKVNDASLCKNRVTFTMSTSPVVDSNGCVEFASRSIDFAVHGNLKIVVNFEIAFYRNARPCLIRCEVIGISIAVSVNAVKIRERVLLAPLVGEIEEQLFNCLWENKFYNVESYLADYTTKRLTNTSKTVNCLNAIEYRNDTDMVNLN